ncbi:MAG: hypothetical protein ACK559_20680, partial [bacterium]
MSRLPAVCSAGAETASSTPEGPKLSCPPTDSRSGASTVVAAAALRSALPPTVSRAGRSMVGAASGCRRSAPPTSPRAPSDRA